MKPNPWEWDEADLLDHIKEQVQESLTLDYKECAALDKNSDKKKTEVSKDVSAFANSAGGTIIYGMKEDKHIPTGLDTGYDPSEISKEWLEQVINSRIQRKIDGVRIKEIGLTTASPGRVAYVMHIPQSVRAPHQAHDKRFYKRYNFESVPMEEYEVRDVARRSEAPDLRVVALFKDNKKVANLTPGAEDRSMPVEIQFAITNEATQPSEYAMIELIVDARVKILYGADTQAGSGEYHITLETGQIPAVRLYQNWRIPHNMPIFQGVLYTLSSHPQQWAFPLSASEAPLPASTYFLVWKVQAPRMAPKQGAYSIVSNGQTLVLSALD